MVRRIDDQAGGFINEVSDLIALEAWKNSFSVPDLSSDKTIFLFSDYGRAGSHYSTYSFFLCGERGVDHFAATRKLVRKTYRLGRRRMSFKKMTDRLKLRALPAFLNAAGRIQGVLLTFAVDRRIQFMFAEQFLEADSTFFANVKKRVLEDMLRIVHFGAQTVTTAFCPGQNILWVTDSDNVVANEDHEQLFGKLAEVTLRNRFLKNEPVRKIRFAVTSIDDETLALEDFASIPDLVAGALSETLGSLTKKGLHVTARICLDRPEVSEKTNRICQWLSLKNSQIEKLCVVFDKFGSDPWDWRPTTFHIGLQERRLINLGL